MAKALTNASNHIPPFRFTSNCSDGVLDDNVLRGGSMDDHFRMFATHILLAHVVDA